MPDLQKVTLNLFDGDFERCRELYPDLGAGKVIRTLVRSFIEKEERKILEQTKGVNL